jgi:hypothetical protein
VSALIADTPPAAPEKGTEQAVAPQAPPPQGGAVPPPPTGPVCPNCGQGMSPEQDWCLNCGVAAAGIGGSGWRPAASIAAITVALVLGAAAAGVAALSKKTREAPVATTSVAQAPPATATTPPLTTPSTPTPGLGGLTKPPRIPLKAVTPPPATTTPTATTPKTTKSEETKAKEEEASKTGGSGAENEPEPILLDTNAAQTYNPYAYPAASFGDPSLAIDGDSSTGWTAQINPATAPRLAEGVLIDLKTPQKLSAVKLVTTTPGIFVQVYGANGHTVPSSITDKAWVPLSHSLTIKKRHARIGLRNKKKAFRFVTLWISRAPASAVGTPEAPGRVTVNELELIPVSG